ncbi:MAG TPA: glycosyl hydrolase family 28 protein [Pseudomonadales bacterium]|nr:glycosyl hydrolase family 28 protein [Pseudomonadales bacterium]
MKHFLKLAASAILSLGLSLSAATFNIRDYGAVGDGKALDTTAIQKAVDTASAAGGGTVLIPAGKFLTGPFTLASKINFHLDAKAVLLIDNDITRYPIVNKRYQDAITVDGAHDLKITGKGAIDGQGEAWWQAFRDNPAMTHRPYLIRLSHCTNLVVSDVTLLNSPMFHLALGNCTDVKVEGITIKAPQHAPNTDGIDPSGWNFLIEDCNIDTGDDNIAIKPAGGRTPGNKNYLVKNCTFGHGHGMSIGGGSANGLDGLTVKNCTFNHTDYGIRIKTLRGNGGLVQNCTYENLKMTAINKCPISITDYYPESNAPKDPAMEVTKPITDRTPTYHNITIRNVTATDCPNAGVIYGLPEAPIDGLTFIKVHLTAETGMKIYRAKNVRFSGSTITVQNGPKLITYDADVSGLK